MLWHLLSLRYPPRKGPDLFDFSSLDQGSVVGAMQPPRPAFIVQGLSHVRLMNDVACHPGAEDEVGAGCSRTVHDMMGVPHARRPTGRVTRVKQVRSVLLDHSRLARKHVDELVYLFVPVPLRESRPRL